MSKNNGNILIVDDNEEILKALKYFLEDYFDLIITEKNPNNIPSLLKKYSFDIFILDMNFKKGENSGKEGIFWMQQIRKFDPDAIVIFITAYGDIELSVTAIKQGATDFIPKPWDDNKLLNTILLAYKLKESRVNIKDSLAGIVKKENDSLLIGKSQAMQKVWDTIKKISSTNANVLIQGENGTGKDLVAHEIHNQSLRNQDVFVRVDVGALSESLFESELFGHIKGSFTDAIEDRKGMIEEANGGTLFLDEIGNIPLNLQSKLLTVLQNREISRIGSNQKINVDIRLITATNKNLVNMIADRQFREDLFYRMNTIQVNIPPLRDRLEDVPVLFNHFLEKYTNHYNKPMPQVSDRIFDNLMKYSWPGNVRELQHVVEKAVILSSNNKLNLDDFIFPGQKIEVLNTLKLEEHEKQLIVRALNKSKGNLSKAAEELGIARKTLYNKMEKYGI